MDIWQRILAAKSEKVAKRVSLLSGLGMLPFYIIFPLIGMAMRLVLDHELGSSETADIAYKFIARHLEDFSVAGLDVGPVILGFAVVGLLSALMSSGDSFLNIISISAVKDFAGWGKKKEHSRRTDYKMIRYTTIVFGVIALFMALVFPHIVDLMVVGISTIALFAPITFFALIRKDVYRYRKAALASILSSFVLNVALFTWGILRPDQFSAKSSFLPAFILAALVLIIGVALTKKR
jgi:SSS family solute:Na+ symporter